MEALSPDSDSVSLPEINKIVGKWLNMNPILPIIPHLLSQMISHIINSSFLLWEFTLSQESVDVALI